MENVYEIQVNGSWLEVNWWIFRSWSGPRQLNSKPFEGEVFYLGSDKPVQSSTEK
jgi:hypothetical protein